MKEYLMKAFDTKHTQYAILIYKCFQENRRSKNYKSSIIKNFIKCLIFLKGHILTFGCTDIM